MDNKIDKDTLDTIAEMSKNYRYVREIGDQKLMQLNDLVTDLENELELVNNEID